MPHLTITVSKGLQIHEFWSEWLSSIEKGLGEIQTISPEKIKAVLIFPIEACCFKGQEQEKRSEFIHIEFALFPRGESSYRQIRECFKNAYHRIYAYWAKMHGQTNIRMTLEIRKIEPRDYLCFHDELSFGEENGFNPL